MSVESWPTVSVVINTYNRGPYLEDALKGLQQLDYPNFEVVVVNGPSTDNSARILAAWSDKVKLADCDEANLSKSRNVGIRATSGDLIAFIDDDAIPHPAWLRQLARNFIYDESVGACGGFTIDNTGVRWQVRKTICDRFGNAFNVSDFFDERPLNFAKTPYYPSLLGTNSCFRAKALRSIGGFDEVFAYLLDETDVCLRLVDSGWKVRYEPDAMVFHQFAESHIRSRNRIAKTLYPSAISKSYFVMRHGAAFSVEEAGHQLERYRSEIATSNKWHYEHSDIDSAHYFSLDQDLYQGIDIGQKLAHEKRDKGLIGDLNQKKAELPLKSFARAPGMRIALISQNYPPANEAGIARWTWMVAKGLAERGNIVHVITRADGEEESTHYADGYWIHRVRTNSAAAGTVAELYDIPENIASWAARVTRELSYLKTFGLQLVSFPIWDLEAIPAIDDPDLVPVVSLHTTYKMAKPFKPEWNLRPIYEFNMVNRMIAAEGDLLKRAPYILANSQAIVSILQNEYGVDLDGRHKVVAHGTTDPLESGERLALAQERRRRMLAGERLRILYVGRFEPRKGFDIAAAVADRLLQQANIEIYFVGDRLDDDWRRRLRLAGCAELQESDRLRFLGVVERAELDDAYVHADIVLTPSRFESFGLVAIEAMAAGRPVLALSAGGLGEVITNGVDGLTWPDGKGVVEQICDAILALEKDRNRLDEMGKAARASFEQKYTIAKMVAEMEAFYRSSLDRSRRH